VSVAFDRAAGYDDEGRGLAPAVEELVADRVEEAAGRLGRTVEGVDFASRRDAAILLLFLDGGLRVAELAGLRVADVDLADRLVYVQGNASRRSGPRLRAIPLGARATRALDRYVRARRRHPLAERPQLWLGTAGRTLGLDGVDNVVKRRSAQAGLKGVHPHQLRHTWAASFRKAGGSEGDLLILGGWRSRAQLDRYGKATAAERAAEAARRYSLGDRLSPGGAGRITPV
jgi:integrase